MSTNLELLRVKESASLRGFANLAHKEKRAWWNTRRWWINALIWPLILGGLVTNMLLISNTFAQNAANEVAAAGGPSAYAVSLGLSVFFEFGIQAVAIGVIILTHDLLVSERQNGVAEWILTKPVSRSAYFLAKFWVNTALIWLFLVLIPAIVTYGILSLKLKAAFPLLPFLSGVGVMTLHSLFYLTLAFLLGTIFESRAAILGVALGFLMGISLIASLIKALIYITPTSLSKIAALVAGGQSMPPDLLWSPLIATAVWSLIFLILGLVKFQRIEF